MPLSQSHRTDRHEPWRWSPFGVPPSFNSKASSMEMDVPQHIRMSHPDHETMQTRWQFRDSMLLETANHRRIHPHGGIAHTGRNIAQVLYDRERKGPRALHPLRRVLLRSGRGDRSPATVFDSPNSSPQTNLYEVAAAAAGVAEDRAATDESDTKKRSLRRVVYPATISHEIRLFAEYASTIRYHSAFLRHLGGDDEIDEQGNRPESSKAVSTISVAFAPDSQTMAPTHGDHTVKISCCNTGRLLQSLDGHPRTPWTVKYHPTDAQVIASGCLGHQVRIWNWVEKTCLQMVRLDYAIISVSFHPSGKLLAVANGTRLHFWGIDPKRDGAGGSNSDNTSESGSRPSQLSSVLTEIDQRHMLRCVHFPPNGKSIIIGGVNPTNEDRRRQRGGIGGGGMSFYLRLWDFDLDTALRPPIDLPAGLPSMRRAISNPRTFVPRALLYNDGGFDVSPDGKTLCACAEYWLPNGVNNAMELLVKEESAPELDGGAKDDLSKSADTSSQAAHTRSIAETHSAVSAALMRLKGMTQDTNTDSYGRSHSFREGMDTLGQLPQPQPQPQNLSTTPTQPRTPSESAPALDFIPRTPPIPREQPVRLSPPSPPGRRFVGLRGTGGRELVIMTNANESVPESADHSNPGFSTPPPPPPPQTPPAPGALVTRPPHPLSMLTSSITGQQEALHQTGGRYVPHVVTVSLDTSPLPPELEHKWPRGKHPGAVANGYRPRLGQLLQACPLDASKASAVTCVKFSPSTDFCLIGYGVREPEGGGKFHPVTALYRIRGGMTHVSTMLSEMDDVNIARFHPDSGHGFVYGTKQGRVRILSPRPWNFYNC